MTGIEYRDTKPDAGQYLTLFETTGWNAVYQTDVDGLRKALSNSWYVVCAYQGNDLVGIGRVVSDGVLYAMIYDMIVKLAFQGRGIGSAILARLIGKCTAHGLRDIQLFSAKGKTQFYSQRGFVERPADAPGMRFGQNRIREQGGAPA